MWGDGGKDGKYVRVEKDPNRPLNRPKKPKLSSLRSIDKKAESNSCHVVAGSGSTSDAMESVAT
jgi:hypothetical protein